ncbi:LamG-like jellyroll fold domain-containing protein [Actinoplanes sp. CA-142083]|uniref:LamG-like jellyroll fold domain-containing protein n=1 Tax=Actinoplanes sp. CA-142083 TaxID=3239903 RepID=UPI003D922B03
MAAPQSAAADTKKPEQRVEVTSARSETRQVFAEPDGTYTMEISAEPQRVRRGKGWVTPDATLQARPDGTVGPRAAVSGISFSGGGEGKPLVHLTADGHRLDLSWPGRLPAPRLEGAAAVYPDVLPGVDLRLEAGQRGYTQELVIKTREAALKSVTYKVATDGLTLSADGKGLQAKDEHGNVAFASGPAAMWDAAGAKAVAEQRAGPGTITLTPDQKLLADPATVYPVTVDPDFSPPSTGWAKVFSGHPDQSYWTGQGDDALAKIGNCAFAGCNGVGTARSFWQFNISALRGAVILGAELNLHETHAPSCSARPFRVYQIDPMTSAPTWNRQPTGWYGPIAQPNVAYGYSSACPANWVGISAGERVAAQLAAGWTTSAYAVVAADENDSLAWKKFDNGYLVVHYDWKPGVASAWSTVGQGPSLGCADDPAKAFTATARPILHATLTDPDGQNVSATFEWAVWNGASVGSQSLAAQANGSSFQVTVPAGAFAHGSRIAWRVKPNDGIVDGPWSTWCGLTVDTAPPDRPAVSSVDYPEGQTAGYVGRTGSFTARSTEPDLLGFQWSLNFQDFPPVNVSSPFFAPAAGGAATIRATPPRTGRNDLYVRAVDKALNVSAAYQSGFNVGSAIPPPVGYWPMDGTGTMTEVPDLSGGGRHATATGIWPGSAAAWTTGRVEDAMRFNASADGTSGGFALASGTRAVDTTGTFAVSVWANLDRADAVSHTAISQASGFSLGYEGDTRRFAFTMYAPDGAPTRATAALAPTPGAWAHLIGMYDAGAKQLRLYVNGALDGTAGLASPRASTGPVQLGRGQAGAYWPGLVDEAKVWNRLLSDDEIRTAAGTPAIEEAFYPLNDDTGDESGNYRTGVLTGGARLDSGAVLLDGVDDAVTTAGPAVRTDTSFTVSARVVLSDDTRTQTVVSQDGFALRYESGRWVMRVGSIVAASAPAEVHEEWVFVAGVYDAGSRQVRLYVDGNEYLAPGRVAANVGGNLAIGRDTTGNFLDGRVDDVHVWTGARSPEDLTADKLSLATSRPTPYTGQLSRYYDHNSHHWVTSGPVPPGTAFEIGLGTMAPPGSPDTRMLYSCLYPGGQYVTLTPGCETSDSRVLGEIGLLFKNPRPDVATVPVYRCVTTKGDHFVAVTEDCEGSKNEGLLGYAQAYRALIRYVHVVAPSDHFTSITGRTAFNGGPAYTYRAEGRLGFVGMATEPGQRPLYACVDGADEFLATSSACDGKQQRYWTGNVWNDPPPVALESRPLMACRSGLDGSGEWFASTDPLCEQRSVLGPLGYVITRL